MRNADNQYKKLILVCTNVRDNGRPCCSQKGSVELFEKIKAAAAAVNPLARVSRTGCLGNCASGATVAVMPDNVWLGQVMEKDIPSIISMIGTGSTVSDSDDAFLSS